MPDFIRYFPFEEHYPLHAQFVQELRHRDRVVVTMGLVLPPRSRQLESNSLGKLCLCSAEPACKHAGECAETSHFKMHEVRLQDRIVRATCKVTWSRLQSELKICADRAVERQLAACSVEVIGDIIGQCSWYDVPDQQLESTQMESCRFSATLAAALHKSRDRPARRQMNPRVWQKICDFLGYKHIGFHLDQLTAKEHLSVIQLRYLEREDLAAEARSRKSSRNQMFQEDMDDKALQSTDIEDPGTLGVEVGP